jgi:hypothetical protein
MASRLGEKRRPWSSRPCWPCATSPRSHPRPAKAARAGRCGRWHAQPRPQAASARAQVACRAIAQEECQR